MALLEITRLHYSIGKAVILNSLDMQLEHGSFACLLGPSGCGKTTLLRLIAGLAEPDSGEIILGGAVISSKGTQVPPDKRAVGMVFQEPSLFPNHTVQGNIRFGLARRGWQERTHILLEHIGLSDKSHAYPHELSGGQQHRVALARALAPSPRLLLLDEPFAHLDPALRLQLREQTKALAIREGVSCLMVTHDHEEAAQVADVIFQMDGQGKLTNG